MSYINAAGNLVVTANNAWRAAIATHLREEGYFSAEAEFFRESETVLKSRRSRKIAMWLDLIQPEQIGALTEAPILADVRERDDETGEPTEIGAVFWFPDYAVRDPMAELARTGRVVFQRAPASGEG